MLREHNKALAVDDGGQVVRPCQRTVAIEPSQHYRVSLKLDNLRDTTYERKSWIEVKTERITQSSSC